MVEVIAFQMPNYFISFINDDDLFELTHMRDYTAGFVLRPRPVKFYIFFFAMQPPVSKFCHVKIHNAVYRNA